MALVTVSHVVRKRVPYLTANGRAMTWLHSQTKGFGRRKNVGVIRERENTK